MPGPGSELQIFNNHGNTTRLMPPLSSRHILFEISSPPRDNVLLCRQAANVQTE